MLNAVKSAYGGKKLFYTFIIINYSLLITNCFSQWVQVSNGITGNLIVNALAYSGNNIYAGTDGNGVYLSANNGANWTQIGLSTEHISSLAIDGDNIFAGSLINGGVYLSTNNGVNWTLVLGSQQVTALAVNGNYVYAGVANNGIYVSTNYGANWTQAMAGFSFALAVNGNNVFAGTTNPGTGVYLSTDNGTTWNQTSLNTHFIPALAVNGNNVFAAADSVGVYVSADNGTNWTQRNEGLSNLRVRSFTILNNYIFAGTYLGGVYRRPLGELTGIHPISNEVPNQFSLSQNYPNPFNPNSKIKFQISKLSTVKLVVFDVLGREVETLVNEQLNPRTYEVEWDGSSFSSGVYYYTLSTGEFSETRKAVLIK